MADIGAESQLVGNRGAMDFTLLYVGCFSISVLAFFSIASYWFLSMYVVRCFENFGVHFIYSLETNKQQHLQKIKWYCIEYSRLFSARKIEY